MNVQEFEVPKEMAEKFEKHGSRLLKLYRVNACLQVLQGENADGTKTCSISHPARRPTWIEVQQVRYGLLAHEETWAIVVTPQPMVDAHWVHLSELRTVEENGNGGGGLIHLPSGRF